MAQDFEGASRILRAWKLLKGTPTSIGYEGRILHEVLRNVPTEDLLQALREEDCALKDMRYAFLETDGRISIVSVDGVELSADLRAQIEPRS